MKKTIIVLFIHIITLFPTARAESLEINGFEISMPDGCRVILSLKGEISNVSLPPGAIMRNAHGQIQFVGKTGIMRDAKGRIAFLGKTNIMRDTEGRIQFLGTTSIMRDAEGRIAIIGDTHIMRNANGEIQSVGSVGSAAGLGSLGGAGANDQVRPVFAVK